MHCDSGYGTDNFMMGFMKGIHCQFVWDSSRVDSLHRTWSIEGVRCWDGTNWVTPMNVSITGRTVTIITTQLYAAIAFIGSPNTVTSASGNETAPAEFRLEQNCPNPFNPTTTIGFTLPVSSLVTVSVYNLLGQEVAILADRQEMNQGRNKFMFDASYLASGVYYYRLRAVAVKATGAVPVTQTKKMLFIR
jgi:hypothetical protein